MPLSEVANFWGFAITEAISDNPIDPNFLQFDTPISAELLAEEPAFPYKARLGNNPGEFELITVTNHVGTLFTITRGEENTTPIAHPIGTRLEVVFTEGHWEEIRTELGANDSKINNTVAAIFYASLAGNKAVLQNSDFSFLQIVPENTPADNLNFFAKNGYAFLIEKIFRLQTDQLFTSLVAPTTEDRIDIVIADVNGIQIKTGIEGNFDDDLTIPGQFVDPSFVFPIPDSDDVIALASLLMKVGSTVLDDVATAGPSDSTITDVRPFA